MNNGNIEKKLKKYKAVSFDIFDTLLKRDVFNPTDVFWLVQKEYEKQNKKKVDFVRVRVEAEKSARFNSSYPDVTIEEIYNELQIQDKDTFKFLEMEMESRILHCNYEMKAIYEKCISLGKDIYIISDMYLPTSFLESVLQREGFVGYKGILVSADERRTKKSGELYRLLLEKYDIDATEIVHIGDSRYADYLGPRKCGIKAIHIPRLLKNTLYMKIPDEKRSFEEKSLFSFINTRIKKYDSREEKLGYEILGPILFFYSQWIHEHFEKVRDENTVLWMAARDMYLFKQAYETIYGIDPKIRYIYISRKSLRPIITYVTGDITEGGNAFSRGKYTLRKIVEKMGYSVDDLPEEFFLDDTQYDIRKLDEYAEIKKILSSKVIIDNERRLAEVGIEYLGNNGLFESNVVLADVGWHGTTQYLLNKIQKSVSKNGSLHGLYLGCLDSTNERIGKNNYDAFVFDEDHYSDFAKGILLFEALILAPHGSTTRYQRKNNEIVPILGEPDNMSSFLSLLQKGAIDFVKDFDNSIISKHLDMDACIVTKSFCELILNPLKEELFTIGDLDYDDFGISKMASPNSISHYVKHPRDLYSDLKHSPWRIGFIYRLLKIRLPYAKLYSFLRAKQGKMT